MIRLELSEVELGNIAEVLDDPEIESRLKSKLLVVTMHHEHGLACGDCPVPESQRG